MLLQIFKVSGHSMMPKFSPNGKVLVSTLPYLFSPPKVGDVVVFKFENKFIIKKISKVNGEWYYVEGENKKDSLDIPKIKRGDILGKVIFKLPKLHKSSFVFFRFS